jgi:general secretion pathway protein G
MCEKIKNAGRARRRGVTLVEVLIVVSIMAVIAGAVTLVAFPELRKARVRTAAIGAKQVSAAAKMYREVDLVETGPECPTVPDLVAAKHLDGQNVRDPWGSTYRVQCEEEDVHGVSNGRDRRPQTADDVRDDLKPGDVERIAGL